MLKSKFAWARLGTASRSAWIACILAAGLVIGTGCAASRSAPTDAAPRDALTHDAGVSPVACAADLSPIDAESTATVPAYIRALLPRFCRYALRCLEHDPGSFDITGVCSTGAAEEALEDTAGIRVALPRDPTACLAALEGPCAPEDPFGDMVDCADLSAPRDVGAACASVSDCASYSCSSDGRSCGVCEARAPGTCVLDRQCLEPGQVCTPERLCVETREVALGEPCDRVARCAEGAFCADDVCVPALALGDECLHDPWTASSPCPEGTFCDVSDAASRYGACAERVALDGACIAEVGGCRVGLACTPIAAGDARCRPRVDVGCGCADDAQCPSSMLCIAGTCTEHLADGQACGPSTPPCRSTCREGRCAALAAGEACTMNDECASAACFSNRCAPAVGEGAVCDHFMGVCAEPLYCETEGDGSSRCRSPLRCDAG